MATLLMIVTPFFSAALVLVLMALIYRRLRHLPRIRERRLLFLLAALILAVTLIFNGEGLLRDLLLRRLSLGALVVAWGYLAFSLLEDLLFRERANGRNVPRLVRDLLRVLVISSLLILVLNRFFNVPIGSLLISSTVASAVIGLALQDILRNVLAGMALQVERSFSPGDWLEVNGQIGRVVELNWRSTRVITVDNTIFILPNSTLENANIANFTSGSPLQALHVQIPVSPRHPPNVVKAALQSAALRADGVLSDPPPMVRTLTYNADSIVYDVKFWMADFSRYVDIRDNVMTNLWYALQRAELSMPTPQRELIMHEAEPRLQSQTQRQEEVVSRLAATELFGSLSHHELHRIAARTQVRIYASGEVLVREGERGDELFVLERGALRAEVQRQAPEPPLVVGRLGPGEIFGERALLTDAPRSATVIAELDSELLVVRRDALAPVLADNPRLPEQLGAVLEARSASNAALFAEARSRIVGEAPLAPGRTGLVERIRSLFGLGG